MRSVLITGAAGFIGGYSVDEFVNAGWHVYALIHNSVTPSLEQMVASGDVTLIRGDLTQFAAFEARLQHELERRGERLDAVVHCAGRASDVGRRHEFRRLNYESVLKLGELSLRLEVGRFVFISTTDVYGLRDFHGETEMELPLQNNRHNPYPEFKIAAEEWIRAHMPSDRYVIIRPAAVWGMGDPTLTPRIVGFLRSSPRIVHFGKWRGQNRWPCAHVRNVAKATLLAVTRPEAAGRAFNIIDSEHTTMDEFYRILASIALPDKRFRSVTLPLWVGRAIGGVVSGISNALNLDHPFTDPSLYALYSVASHLDFSNAAFLELLEGAGQTILSREEGIDELKRSVER